MIWSAMQIGASQRKTVHLYSHVKGLDVVQRDSPAHLFLEILLIVKYINLAFPVQGPYVLVKQ